MNIDELNYTNGLIPVITQDTEGHVLMQAYANKEALGRTLDTGKAWYYSRSRRRLWMKGEESGYVQDIISVLTDCDSDSLLYIVRQTGKACHKDTYSCFTETLYGERTLPILEEVYETILERKRQMPKNSYVSGIIEDREMMIAKIREESEELVEAFEIDDNLVWEAADLIFHTFLLLANKGVEWEELVKEFRKRRK